MFNVILYEFSKKINSTKKVNVSGTSFQCVIKDIDSILTPVIELEPSNKIGDDVPLFNYAYIPVFKRYYFIDDIAYTLGAWTLSMHCDVLATYAENIKNSSQYVLRSASQNNPNIIDNFYKTYVSGDHDEYAIGSMRGTVQRYNSSDSTWQSVNYFNRSIGQGEIIIGVLGGSAYGVTYYAMPVASFQEFLNAAFSLVPSDMSDVSTGIANAIFDPIQYITYCRWFPMKPLPRNIGNSMVHSIYLGNYKVDFPTSDTFCYQFNGMATETYRCYIDIPSHPQAHVHPYLKLDPFSEYSLMFQPFGNIPLDSTKIYGSGQITVQWTIDYCTGQALLELYSENASDSLFYSNMSEIGVTLPVSTLVMDWKAGMAVSALTYLKSTQLNDSSNYLASALGINTNPIETDATGHKLRAANKTNSNMGLLDTMQNVLGSALGNVASTGTAGSFMAYNYRQPVINAWFRQQAGKDELRFGEPLCRNVLLSTLSGFTLCANATINYHGPLFPTADEQNAVAEALNSGVYLE